MSGTWARLTAACALLVALAAHAAPVADRVKGSGVLKVCIWPDYYGITYRHPIAGRLIGLDIDLSAAFASDLGVAVKYVESSFPRLVEDLQTDQCDIAMFAIAVLPQRAQQLAFSDPYLRSDIYGITTVSSRTIASWADIDRPGVRVAVQAGTFMEPVMRDSLARAELVVVKPPATREGELESGRVDVFMTDYPYSRRLLDNADWAKLIAPPKPFHVLPYAYAVKRGDDAWLATVNAFVARMKRDGRLEAAARKHGLFDIVVR